MIEKLCEKDNKESYHYLLELEKISTESNELYKYFNSYIKMLYSDISYIRVRGFRMISSQAKWDKDNLINKNINLILSVLPDDKPTNVRQYLQALKPIIKYKKELIPVIKDTILRFDYLKYKESMQGLIKRDLKELITLCQTKNI